jgi:cobalt-zinc-cadmium efflux system outer membrane protein
MKCNALATESRIVHAPRWLVRLTLLMAGMPIAISAQTVLTWPEIKDKFEAANPTLKAAQLSIDESRAAEITAYLRPNPDFSLATDGTQIDTFHSNGYFRPFAGTQLSPSVSYLHELAQKRELRLETAKKTTDVAVSAYSDQERGLTFSLRNAYVQVLQNKAFLQNAKDNLDYWDRELRIDRQRFDAGDLAQIDYDRLRLQRIPFESDFETATVNLRTAKIQLLQLLDDRTPIEQFDVTGTYDYTDALISMDEFRNAALNARPDLREALQNVELAKLNHKLAVANGSADPTFSVWYTHNPSFNNPYAHDTIGASVSIPLRIFDRNQGEKARTQLDIGRNEQLVDAAQAQVFNDVDSAYVTLVAALNLLRPYKAQYLKLASDTRDKVQFAYQNGGASLLDYLDAEKTYRDTRLAYLNLIGSYLTAAAQMNLAAGREVLQ